uniref:Uncharacterized protein n=1 Tax=Anopheles minimus TaxID=112268 RepID=A0A182VZ84_9DIPT
MKQGGCESFCTFRSGLGSLATDSTIHSDGIDSEAVSDAVANGGARTGSYSMLRHRSTPDTLAVIRRIEVERLR